MTTDRLRTQLRGVTVVYRSAGEQVTGLNDVTLDVTNGEGADYIAAYGEVSQTWFTDASDLDHFDARGGEFFAEVRDMYIYGARLAREIIAPGELE